MQFDILKRGTSNVSFFLSRSLLSHFSSCKIEKKAFTRANVSNNNSNRKHWWYRKIQYAIKYTRQNLYLFQYIYIYIIRQIILSLSEDSYNFKKNFFPFQFSIKLYFVFCISDFTVLMDLYEWIESKNIINRPISGIPL